MELCHHCCCLILASLPLTLPTAALTTAACSRYSSIVWFAANLASSTVSTLASSPTTSTSHMTFFSSMTE